MSLCVFFRIVSVFISTPYISEKSISSPLPAQAERRCQYAKLDDNETMHSFVRLVTDTASGYGYGLQEIDHQSKA